MPLKPSNPDGDLHPPELIEKWGTSLCERLGESSYNRRLAIERTVNPARPYNSSKFAKHAVHGLSVALLYTALGLTGRRTRARANCWRTEVRQNTVKTGHFSADAPLRLLHLSDLHLDTRLSQAKEWATKIHSLEYDLALITGDFFNAFQLPGTHELTALEQLLNHINAPVYGILGNHD